MFCLITNYFIYNFFHNANVLLPPPIFQLMAEIFFYIPVGKVKCIGCSFKKKIFRRISERIYDTFFCRIIERTYDTGINSGLYIRNI
jgi:hypothetical protein